MLSQTRYISMGPRPQHRVLLGAPSNIKNPHFAPLIIFFKRKLVVPPRLRFRLCFFAFFFMWSLLAYLLSVFFPVWSCCCVKVWFFEAVRGLVLLCSCNVLFSFRLDRGMGCFVYFFVVDEVFFVQLFMEEAFPKKFEHTEEVLMQDSYGRTSSVMQKLYIRKKFFRIKHTEEVLSQLFTKELLLYV